MLFFGTFVEVEFIEEGISAGSESKWNQLLPKRIKQSGQMSPPLPEKKGVSFVIIILPFSVHVITILFSCVYHEKKGHTNKVREVSYIVQKHYFLHIYYPITNSLFNHKYSMQKIELLLIILFHEDQFLSSLPWLFP